MPSLLTAKFTRVRMWDMVDFLRHLSPSWTQGLKWGNEAIFFTVFCAGFCSYLLTCFPVSPPVFCSQTARWSFLKKESDQFIPLLSPSRGFIVPWQENLNFSLSLLRPSITLVSLPPSHGIHYLLVGPSALPAHSLLSLLQRPSAWPHS